MRRNGNLPWTFPPTPMLSVVMIALIMGSCTTTSLFKSHPSPLKEFTLEGKGTEKVLVVPVRGTITNNPEESILRNKPGMVQEVVSHLEKAEKDKSIKAVLLKIESPGGSVNDSDILFHELERFKAKSEAKIVTIIMNLAASGGYYAALASDRIVAHPQSVTGSVGTIFIQPKLVGLMDKIGMKAEVTKSARYKDMGSPFRDSLPEEREMIQAMIDDMNNRFLQLAARKRTFTQEQYRSIATARIFTASQALEAGLIDSIGYMEDALKLAKELAGVPEDGRVVVYRRTKHPDDNVYNPVTTEGEIPGPINLRLSDILAIPGPGFYYLWAPEFEN